MEAPLQLCYSNRPDHLAYYLDDRYNIQATRLLTKLRLSIYCWRVAKICKWAPSGSHCKMCTLRVPESVQHFLQVCPAFLDLRTELAARLEVLRTAGEPGCRILTAFNCGGDTQLGLLLGARWPLPCSEDHLYRVNCAKAWWACDRNIKNFVLLAWRRREAAGFPRGRVSYQADSGRCAIFLCCSWDRAAGLGRF